MSSPVAPPDSASLLELPLAKLLGGKTAAKLADVFGYRYVEELLRHVPRRYAERGNLTDLGQLPLDEHVTVLAQVREVTTRRMAARRGTLTEVILGDDNPDHRLKAAFFNQAWRERDLQPGRQGLFAGKVTRYRNSLQLTHPDYQLLHQGEDASAEEQLEQFGTAPIALYPAAAGLQSWQIRKAILALLPLLDQLPDPIPESVRDIHSLPSLAEAFRAVHTPRDTTDWRAGRARFRWEEAFIYQVVLEQRRAAIRCLPSVPRTPRPGGLLDALDARLPFTLTDGQREVEAQLLADLSRPYPMHRLLQGDVGAGKTILALRAMLAVVDSGGQAALLAPTEVLAYQHYRSITHLLGPLALGGQLGSADTATRVALLTGSAGATQRRAALADAAGGAAGIVIGTHALLYDPVRFADLGLVVVDEQHRFGVEQREALREKAEHPPHVLVMTATPIPRTVAMTVFGDLDVSTLRQLPAGRQPIQTTVVPAQAQAWVDRMWQRVREEVAQGRRVYVVCPRIGDDEVDDQSDAEDTSSNTVGVVELTAQLQAGPLAGLRVELLHGRLPAEVKDERMRAFAAGELDVLVSTTVIEVGVDVPEATVMVIMDAQRFGISQLHQLRGRVGRGSHPSLCLLVTTAPEDSPSRERLDAVAATTDGFELARLDVQARHEGDVLGATQSGRRSSLRLLSVLRDETLITRAKDAAAQVVGEDPGLDSHPELAAAVEKLLEDQKAAYLDKG